MMVSTLDSHLEGLHRKASPINAGGFLANQFLLAI
jgi:hypothetical protein